MTETPEERARQAGKNVGQWIRQHKTKILTVGVVVLSISNRSLRHENARLLTENLEMLKDNEALGRLVDALITPERIPSTSVMNEFFGAKR